METASAIHKIIPAKAGRKEWIGLAVLALPTLLVAMDATVTYLALPALSATMKPSSAQLLWITDVFTFLEGGLLITMGTLGDRIGRRRLLLTGAVAFAIASAFAAFSSTPGMLIAARALLGVAGATLLPSTLSIIRNMFHDNAQRTFAIGIWTTCFAAGTMLGPLLGGMLLDHFWWGSVFLIGAPVMLLFVILGPLLLPEFKDPGASRMDLFSALLSLLAILSVIYGVKHIAENARLEMVSIIAIIVGLVLAGVFIRRQQKLADPLIDLRLFKITAFRSTLVALLVSLFCWSGLYLFIAQYLQLVLDMDPLRAGLWTIPAAAVSMAGCMLAPVTVRKIRRGYMMAIGMTMMSVGLFMLSQIQITLGLSYLVAASIILSFGCGITVTLGVDMVVATAPPERAGAAAGLYETSTTLGTALGVAILGSIGTAVYRGKMGVAVSNLSEDVIRAAKGTLGGALAVAKQVPRSSGAMLLSTAREAFVQSMRFSAMVAAVLLITTAVVTAVLLGRAGMSKD